MLGVPYVDPSSLRPYKPRKACLPWCTPSPVRDGKMDLPKVPEFPQYDNKLHLGGGGGGGVVLICKDSGKEYMPKRTIKWTNTYRRVCKEFIGLGQLD